MGRKGIFTHNHTYSAKDKFLQRIEAAATINRLVNGHAWILYTALTKCCGCDWKSVCFQSSSAGNVTRKRYIIKKKTK